jgi:acyl carrier protein
MTTAAVEATVAVLVGVLREVAPGELPAEVETSGPDTVRALGLTSVRILEFMIEVEDRLGIEWGEDLAPEVIASFEEMAAYIVEQRSATADGSVV